ncbi:MAG: hypothetical protein N3A72_08475 [bacterium]|nr:hypothetical protein [bacterium]
MINNLLVFFLLISIPVWGYGFSSGPPDYRTGAPGEMDCRQCHTSYPLNSGGGIFRFENVPSSYVGNGVYPINLRILQSGQTRWGFELKSTAGTILVADTVNTQLSSGIFLKHTAPGTFAGTSSGAVWSFHWQAPNDTTTTVLFYAAGNAANNNGNSFGDYIYTTVATTVRAVPITYVNQYGSFTSSSDTTRWYFEKYGDAISPGTLSWLNSFGGQTGGLLKITQTPGQKAKLTQIFTVTTSGWYTARAKFATDIADVSKQQKVYLYLQELDNSTTVVATGNQVIASGNGGFGQASVWRFVTISFYVQNTVLAVQAVGINPSVSGITCGLYIDEIWVASGEVISHSTVSLANSSFDNGTSGWLLEIYGDGVGTGIWSQLGSWYGHTGVLFGTQTASEKAKLSQFISLSSITTTFVSVWVYSGATSFNQTQKVYLYLYSNDNAYNKVIESGNAILQPGKWNPNQWRQVQFAVVPNTQHNVVQIVSINPVGRPPELIFFDEIILRQ